jgi:hypothetical protein
MSLRSEADRGNKAKVCEMHTQAIQKVKRGLDFDYSASLKAEE